MLALGLEPGDEVLVPAYTFPATANVVALAGLKPVLVDVDPETMNIDPAQIDGRPAHEGDPRRAPLRPAGAAARSCPTLPLLEDAAGALGARYRGRACGGLGIAGCLSFHPRKIVTTGEGGAVTTYDAAVADAVAPDREPRLALARRRPTCRRPGLNYRLSDILCAVGIPQLGASTSCSPRARAIADGYTERLAHLPVLLPRADDGDVHGWQAYVLQVDDRDRVLAALRAQGIEAQIGTYALHAPRRLPRPGRVPGRRARLRARARAAVPHAAHRQRSRPGGGGP